MIAPGKPVRISNFEVRGGYTLLELLLSLALMVLVVAGIGMAIKVYYDTLVSQQRAIEQELVGRAVLNMLANDLRAGLQYKAADVSGLENLDASQMMMAGLGGMTGGATGGTGGTGDTGGDPTGGTGGGDPTGGATGGTGDATGDTTGGTAEEETDPALEDNAWYRPSFIGLSDQFTLDVSRLPRLDQYNILTTGLDATATPSDIKRISWMVSLSPGQQSQQSLDPAGDALGGLFRREVDRAVSAYRGEPDSPDRPDEYAKLLATEVVSMQLRYFDGTDWKADWASETAGGYPLAVEIVLMIDGDRHPSSSSAAKNTAINTDNLKAYRLVVHLPVAEIIPEEDE